MYKTIALQYNDRHAHKSVIVVYKNYSYYDRFNYRHAILYLTWEIVVRLCVETMLFFRVYDFSYFCNRSDLASSSFCSTFLSFASQKWVMKYN